MGLDDNTIIAFSTDNGAENFTWPDGGQTPPAFSESPPAKVSLAALSQSSATLIVRRMPARLLTLVHGETV
jgi:hypothetical protein